MAASVHANILRRSVVAQTQRKHTASLIFLHGSGDTGDGVRAWLRELFGKDMAFPHIRIIYPTAPKRPYTPMMGHLSTVWFDRIKIANNVPENQETVDAMAHVLGQLIDSEVRDGVPKQRIIIGGFSMGGTMAMHLGYRFHPEVAGVFSLSSFLNINSLVYKAVREHQGPLPPCFQCHGTSDPLVLPAWAELTHKELKKLGINSEFHVYENMFHELHLHEVLKLKDWILNRLPP